MEVYPGHIDSDGPLPAHLLGMLNILGELECQAETQEAQWKRPSIDQRVQISLPLLVIAPIVEKYKDKANNKEFIGVFLDLFKILCKISKSFSLQFQGLSIAGLKAG